MKVLKLFFNLTIFLFTTFLLIYVLLPKGYILIHLLEKAGLGIYAESVKEGFIESRLSHVTVTYYYPDFKRKQKVINTSLLILFPLHFSQVYFNGYSLTVPCQKKRFLKITYLPPKKVKIVFNNFPGTCAGRSEIKNISGEIFYIYSKGFFGSLKVKTSFPGFYSLNLYFKKNRIELKNSNFIRKFYLNL